MTREISAPNVNGGTKSHLAFEQYRRAFGKSVDTFNNVPDMDRHIQKRNKEFGINIEPLGNK